MSKQIYVTNGTEQTTSIPGQPWQALVIVRILTSIHSLSFTN